MLWAACLTHDIPFPQQHWPTRKILVGQVAAKWFISAARFRVIATQTLHVAVNGHRQSQIDNLLPWNSTGQGVIGALVTIFPAWEDAASQ